MTNAVDDLLGIDNSEELLKNINFDAYVKDIAAAFHKKRQQGLQRQVPEGYWLGLNPAEEQDQKLLKNIATSKNVRDKGEDEWEVNVNTTDFYSLPAREQRVYTNEVTPILSAFVNDPDISREALIEIAYLAVHGPGSGSAQSPEFNDARPAIVKLYEDHADIALKQLRPTHTLDPDVLKVAEQMHLKRQQALRNSEHPDCWQVTGYQSKTEIEAHLLNIPLEHCRRNQYGHLEINHTTIAMKDMPLRIQNEFYIDKAMDIVAMAKNVNMSVEQHVNANFTQYLDKHYPGVNNELEEVLKHELTGQITEARATLGIHSPEVNRQPEFSM